MIIEWSLEICARLAWDIFEMTFAEILLSNKLTNSNDKFDQITISVQRRISVSNTKFNLLTHKALCDDIQIR